MGVAISKLPAMLAELGAGAMSARTLAFRCNTELQTVMTYVRAGKLVVIRREKSGPMDRSGIAIVCAPEHAAQHGRAA